MRAILQGGNGDGVSYKNITKLFGSTETLWSKTSSAGGVYGPKPTRSCIIMCDILLGVSMAYFDADKNTLEQLRGPSTLSISGGNIVVYEEGSSSDIYYSRGFLHAVYMEA